jgi:alkylated DNA nucleotide flippase Atl1
MGPATAVQRSAVRSATCCMGVRKCSTIGFTGPASGVRSNAKRMASRLRDGEWTTYGDISIAVRGDTKAARGVGRAAATITDFPNAEKILMERGEINPNWHDGEGRGPERCRQLLEDQEVRFAADGRADESQRVAWDELRRRDEVEPVVA